MDDQTLAAKPEPSRAYRWAVLIFISLAMFGNYYAYDSIGPVFDLLKAQLQYSDEDLGLLYTVYSVAAIIVLLAGGYVIDKFGTKRTIIVFGAICLLAAFITAVSPKLGMMLTGRFLLGLGAEPLIVAVSAATAKWFKGKELSLAFGINLTIARIGQVAADWSPSWAGSFYDNWQDPLWLSTALTSVGVVGGFLYWIAESRAERKYVIGGQGETEKLELKGLYTFGKSYWYVVGLCVVFYSTIFPFRAFAIKYFIEAHGMSREAGGILNSFLPFSAMIATPLFGLLVDKIGKRAMLMTAGSLILLPLFVVVTYAPPGSEITFSLPLMESFSLPMTLVIVMSLLGISFSLIPAIMWPAVAYLVEQRRLGSAYSLMTLCQQVGVSAVPWVIGLLNDAFSASPENPSGYAPGMWVFTGLSLFGLLFSYLLWKSETGTQAHGLETITTKG
ncbi:MAG: MFS transporter [Ignavibacteriae bacterium]|nr:MFS transporter [Ignavibacteriota bacterium]